MPGSDAEAVLLAGDREDGEQAVQVRERFAHSHDDDVREARGAVEALGCRVGEVAEPHELFEHFTDGQISLDAVEPARAEDAAHAATDLSANARRRPAIVLDQHALDHAVVVQAKHQLVGVVRGDEMPFDAGAERFERAGQLGPQFLRQVGHLLEAFGPGGENLPANLVRAHRRLAVLREPSAKFLHRNIQDAGKGFGRSGEREFQQWQRCRHEAIIERLGGIGLPAIFGVLPLSRIETGSCNSYTSVSSPDPSVEVTPLVPPAAKTVTAHTIPKHHAHRTLSRHFPLAFPPFWFPAHRLPSRLQTL